MTTQRLTACPNCHAALPPGARQCSVCKLAVSQMGAFAAAKLAARRKGFGATQVETRRRGLWRHPAVIGGAAIAVLVLGFVLTRGSAPPAWTKFPATQIEAAQGLLTGISKGDNAGFDRAYALVTPSVKDANNSDEKGMYEQLYLEINKYLAGEFGENWLGQTAYEMDPGNSDLVIAHVGLETLHISTAVQTPADRLASAGGHYAVTGIGEFDIQDAAKFQQAEAVNGGLRMLGAGGAIQTIAGIQGALGGGRHETPMQAKMRLLPQLRDPHAVNKFEVYQTWPVRKDPVVHRRLDAIVHDDRYDGEIKQVAEEVLKDRVSDEELIAAHVQD